LFIKFTKEKPKKNVNDTYENTRITTNADEEGPYKNFDVLCSLNLHNQSKKYLLDSFGIKLNSNDKTPRGYANRVLSPRKGQSSPSKFSKKAMEVVNSKNLVKVGKFYNN